MENQGSIIEDLEDGSPETQKWYQNGKLHRGDDKPGPARAGAASSCITCHGDFELLVNAEFAHSVHSDARCEMCHGGESSVKSANSARNMVKWVGLIAIVTIISGLGLNYLIVRKRMAR